MEKSTDNRGFMNYLIFFFGQQVSLFGSSIIQFVIVWWVTLETGSIMYLSIASLFGFLPYANNQCYISDYNSN